MSAEKRALSWDRFAAADPGLLRLIAALRAVLGLALTLAALTALRQPPTMVLAGGFTTVVTSLGISALRPRRQWNTLSAGLPVTVVAMAAGALLAPCPVAAKGAFLLLIFAAVYVRRFERWGQDLGIFAFMAFFLTQFARIRPHQLPQLAGVLAIAFAAAALTRFGLVRAPASATLGRLRTAFDRRCDTVLRGTAKLPTTGRAARAARRTLERDLDRLHDGALLIQDFVREGAPARPRAGRASRPGPESAELDRVIGAEAHAQRLAAIALRRVGDEARTPADRPARPARRHGRDRASRRPATVRFAGPRRRTTRQAFQVTAAAALATLGGQLLSPRLWYWAVATAWVVYINAEHTGDILLQSGRRLIGTIAGVLFGYGLALSTAGHPSWAVAFLLACVFGMFYTPAGRYWAVTFFITGSLSMVLQLLHTFSPELLALRIQETALGAACGILAAVLVVPTSLRNACDDRLREFLAALNRLVRDVPDPKPVLRTNAEVAALDQALEAFRRAVHPLGHPLNPRRAERARARHLLEVVEAAASHARNLATRDGRATPPPAGGDAGSVRPTDTSRSPVPEFPTAPNAPATDARSQPF
ncbi:FUSC family protein [Embleya sp. NPDC005971]|uniref:FUSC family protein n=1 Tax=Embleya sp. NPDC005971 TaxID=3156724 RepID=UPI0033C911D7